MVLLYKESVLHLYLNSNCEFCVKLFSAAKKFCIFLFFFQEAYWHSVVWLLLMFPNLVPGVIWKGRTLSMEVKIDTVKWNNIKKIRESYETRFDEQVHIIHYYMYWLLLFFLIIHASSSTYSVFLNFSLTVIGKIICKDFVWWSDGLNTCWNRSICHAAWLCSAVSEIFQLCHAIAGNGLAAFSYKT